MAAIESERFVITGLGQFRMSVMPVNVRDMSNGVRNTEHIALGTVESEGFLIMLKGNVAVLKVAFNLAERGERLRKVSSRAGVATECDGFDEIAFGIGKAMLSARLKSLQQELIGCGGHGDGRLATFRSFRKTACCR